MARPKWGLSRWGPPPPSPLSLPFAPQRPCTLSKLHRIYLSGLCIFLSIPQSERTMQGLFYSQWNRNKTDSPPRSCFCSTENEIGLSPSTTEFFVLFSHHMLGSIGKVNCKSTKMVKLPLAASTAMSLARLAGQQCHCAKRPSSKLPPRPLASSYQIGMKALKAGHCAGSCQKGPLSVWSSSGQICNDFILVSIGKFLPEIPKGWFCVEWISQMGEFLRRSGFLCCISDEACLVINTVLVKFRARSLSAWRRERGGGLLERSVKFATKRNNPWNFGDLKQTCLLTSSWHESSS